MSFTAPRFELSERQLDPDTTAVAVAGELHVSTAPQFSARLDAAVRDATGAVIVDMSDVSFIDSTGCSVLLGASRTIRRGGGRLALVCTNPTVLRLFEITKLDRTFDIHPTVEDAAARLRAAGEV